jgi:hypothetical protein
MVAQPTIPVLRRQQQEDHEFKVKLGLLSPCLKKRWGVGWELYRVIMGVRGFWGTSDSSTWAGADAGGCHCYCY